MNVNIFHTSEIEVCYIKVQFEIVEGDKKMMDDLQLYIPHTTDGWFYVKMMSDPEMMVYNVMWFLPDGCILELQEK